MTARRERLALQIVVAAACIVPLGAGIGGMLLGARFVAPALTPTGDLDSHFRYLSGLLLGIGLGFLSTIPRIERQGARFRLLTGMVVVGGCGRLLALVWSGAPSPTMTAALVMELVVTPLLAVWQCRIARSHDRGASPGRPNRPDDPPRRQIALAIPGAIVLRYVTNPDDRRP